MVRLNNDNQAAAGGMLHISCHVYPCNSYVSLQLQSRCSIHTSLDTPLHTMAALSKLINLPDVVMSLSTSSPSATSATSPSKVISPLAAALEHIYDATQDHVQMALAQYISPPTSRDTTATAQILNARSTSTRTTTYRLESSATGLSVQAPDFGIVGGIKGNIRGPQCCIM